MSQRCDQDIDERLSEMSSNSSSSGEESDTTAPEVWSDSESSDLDNGSEKKWIRFIYGATTAFVLPLCDLASFVFSNFRQSNCVCPQIRCCPI